MGIFIVKLCNVNRLYGQCDVNVTLHNQKIATVRLVTVYLTAT